MCIKAAKTNTKGMTLLEVLVAIFVLALVAMPLLNMFLYNSTLVRNARNIGDTTYTAQAVMEDLQNLDYNELYNFTPLPGIKSNYQIHSVMNSGTVYVTRPVTIDRLPYGAFNDLAGGTACYAHLLINGGSASFTGPDGVRRTGLSLSSGVSMTTTTITIGGSTYNLNKPAGTNLILIIHAGTASIAALTISLPSSVVYVLYALSPTDANAQNITINNGNANSRQYRKFNSKTDATQDPPPGYLLVNAVCKIYRADGTVESMVQNTLRVNLP